MKQAKKQTKNKKDKYELLNLEIITECVCKFLYYKKTKNIWLKKALILSFLQTIWMSASAYICKFPNEHLFPGLRGLLI